MYLGFLTGCMGDIPLAEKAKWAADNGLKAIEISCWPRANDRDYSATDIDVDSLTKDAASEIRSRINDLGLSVTSLAYYDNNLSADAAKRSFINEHLYKVIDAAQLLGVELVGTFIGRNHEISLEENFDEFEKVFSKIVRYAEDRGIKIMIENCPMTGWQVPGLPGTISFSPELWRELFTRIPSSSFGLNYDPSHMAGMLMDYITPISEFKDRIFHTHAKDMLVRRDILAQTGIYNKQLSSSFTENFCKPVMPGRGDVDFSKWIASLKSVGYNGVVSIEHEDPDFEGSLDKVKAGLLSAIGHLQPLINTD